MRGRGQKKGEQWRVTEGRQMSVGKVETHLLHNLHKPPLARLHNWKQDISLTKGGIWVMQGYGGQRQFCG